MVFIFSVVLKSDKNLMTVSNLGVCFGPTLLRPEEETVASIVDLKFYNIVVEILIENYEKIFNSEPDKIPLQSEKLTNSLALQRQKSPSDSYTSNNYFESIYAGNNGRSYGDVGNHVGVENLK